VFTIRCGASPRPDRFRAAGTGPLLEHPLALNTASAPARNPFETRAQDLCTGSGSSRTDISVHRFCCTGFSSGSSETASGSPGSPGSGSSRTGRVAPTPSAAPELVRAILTASASRTAPGYCPSGGSRSAKTLDPFSDALGLRRDSNRTDRGENLGPRQLEPSRPRRKSGSPAEGPASSSRAGPERNLGPRRRDPTRFRGAVSDRPVARFSRRFRPTGR